MQGREVVQWYEMLFPLKSLEGTWVWGLDLGLHFHLLSSSKIMSKSHYFQSFSFVFPTMMWRTVIFIYEHVIHSTWYIFGVQSPGLAKFKATFIIKYAVDEKHLFVRDGGGELPTNCSKVLYWSQEAFFLPEMSEVHLNCEIIALVTVGVFSICPVHHHHSLPP